MRKYKICEDAYGHDCKWQDPRDPADKAMGERLANQEAKKRVKKMME